MLYLHCLMLPSGLLGIEASSGVLQACATPKQQARLLTVADCRVQLRCQRLLCHHADRRAAHGCRRHGRAERKRGEGCRQHCWTDCRRNEGGTICITKLRFPRQIQQGYFNTAARHVRQPLAAACAWPPRSAVTSACIVQGQEEAREAAAEEGQAQGLDRVRLPILRQRALVQREDGLRPRAR